MRQLTDSEFEQTFSDAMLSIPFDDSLLEEDLSAITIELQQPDRAYRNSAATFEHHLLSTETKNKFVVIIVNLETNNRSWYPLDLHEKYGITPKKR